jgi:hypothetical protein
MRRSVAIETGLALLLAFFFAPFQHVHAGHAGDIHAHFFSSHTAPHTGEGVHLEADEDDDHAHASAMDTFTIVLPNVLTLSLPARIPISLIAPPETFAPVPAVEQRSHDPPYLDLSTPRAPPL